jgi:hypothetical protein
MAESSTQQLRGAPSLLRHTIDRLNSAWHQRALTIFMVIVLAHWLEHLFQAFQIWALGWPRHHALGALGLIAPWLVHSEWLHYGYALAMLIGLALLRPAFVGTARVWWNIALAIQVWHHFEHALLLLQVQLGRPFFGAASPTSILQLFVPRVELHLFYNAVVFAPMVIAMIYHRYPPASDKERAPCDCAHIRPALG